MTHEELMDIRMILILFRADIRFHYAPMICESLAVYFANRAMRTTCGKSIRRMIRDEMDYESLEKNDRLKWAFTLAERPEMSGVHLGIDSLFSFIFRRIRDLLSAHRYEQTKDFVDSVHCLPDIIIDTARIPSSYIRIYIKTYARISLAPAMIPI